MNPIRFFGHMVNLRVTTATATGIATYPPGAGFGPREMRDFEFVWLIEGSAEYRWGSQTVAAAEGAILLCRPGTTDSFQWDRNHRTRHAYFHFNVSRSPVEWGRPHTWPIVRHLASGDVLRPLFRHLLTWHGRGNDPLEKLSVQHMLTAFVTGEYASADVPPTLLPPPVDRALAHLHAALDADPAASMTLGDLAAVACLTPEHLCRLFKTATGHSPVETFRMARLDRAAMLLARSNYSVKQIASLCGFASAFHFSRRFAKAFGQPPSEMRRRILDGATAPLPLLLSRSEI